MLLFMLHTIEQSLLIFLIVIGVLAFRLTAGNGFHLIYRYLPQSWQRWLYDRKRPSAQKTH